MRCPGGGSGEISPCLGLSWSKKNPLAVHGYFATRESAERHLAVTVPEYVERGYFMDKSLRAEDFEVREAVKAANLAQGE